MQKNGNIYHQAQLRYGNAVANSNVAVGEILEVLAATKTAVRKTYGQNDRVTYVVSIVNSGNTAMTGLTVADDLGAYAFGTDTLVPLTYVADTVRYYSNGILQTTPAVTAGPPLSVSGISVPAGGNVTIVYEAETNAFAPLLAESEITNTVTISGGGITPVTAKETVIAESGPKLTITKSVSPVPVTENGTLTYTFLIQNTGNTAALAATGAVVTDIFDPVLSNLAVSYNGTAWSVGSGKLFLQCHDRYFCDAGRADYRTGSNLYAGCHNRRVDSDTGRRHTYRNRNNLSFLSRGLPRNEW